MAVRHERTHAECLGQRPLRGIALRCHLTEETASVRFMAPFLVLTGER